MGFSRAAYVTAVLTALTLGLILRPTGAYAGQNQGLTLTSSAFENGRPIPLRYTCAGESKSPPLKWTGVPHNARSMVLIVADPDAPMGTFVHWVIFNLPPATSGLPANVPPATRADGGKQGNNGRGDLGYTGPCPPPGAPHHYHFHLYALDRELTLKPGARASEVEAALKGHVLASSELVGTFAR